MSVGGVSDLVVDQDILAGPPLRSNTHFTIVVTMSVSNGTRSLTVGFLTRGAVAALSTMAPNSPLWELECFFALHLDSNLHSGMTAGGPLVLDCLPGSSRTVSCWSKIM